jgi:predicted Rdx family selenoprotein
LEKNLDDVSVTTEQGPLRSEFEVLVDGVQIFSRLEQMRYPESPEIIACIRSMA